MTPAPLSLPLLASALMDWLLGLSRVSWSDPRASLGWRWPLEPWLWLAVIAACAVLAWWSYRRLLGPLWARVTLAGVRALLLLLLAALLAGPVLTIRQDQVEPDWLLVMVDTSGSMSIADMDAAGGGAAVSRFEAVKAALARQAELFGPEQAGGDRRVLWLGFDAATMELPPAEQASAWQASAGRSTLIRTAIEQALQRAAGRPISGIVLISDGRSPQPTGVDLVRRLQQQGVSVFSVPVGAQRTALDLAVNRVDAPERAFVKDKVPVRVWLDRDPADVAVDPARVKVRLLDAQSGQVLDEKAAGDEQLRGAVDLTAESEAAGPTRWRVEVVYEAGPAGGRDAELVTDNNRWDLDLDFVDRPIGVLYVEGYPRWEYRYLKNLLVREKSIRSSIVLVSADRGFAQEGSLPITRAPTTAEEMKPYDVVIVGDVPAGYFSPQQLEMIRDHVAVRGGGLLWIGGEQHTPVSYEGTALAGLLPMRRPGDVTAAPTELGPISLRPTPLADALQVMQLGGAAEAARGHTGFPANLPALLWVQELGDLKAGVEVLAQAGPGMPRTLPLITRSRYGAGEVVYLGSDEIWRWRYGRGDLFFEQFYLQMIRMLARAGLHQTQDRAVLTVSNRRADVEQALVVELVVTDQLLTTRDLPRVGVEVRSEDAGGGGAALERIELLRQSPGGETGGGVTYRGVWRPLQPGRLRLRVAEAGLDDLGLTQVVDVLRPDDEMRRPTPDHARLQDLATVTGGRVLDLNDLSELPGLIPNRARRTPNDISESLWDSYLSFFVVLILLAGEWIGRKIIRLA